MFKECNVWSSLRPKHTRLAVIYRYIYRYITRPKKIFSVARVYNSNPSPNKNKKINRHLKSSQSVFHYITYIIFRYVIHSKEKLQIFFDSILVFILYICNESFIERNYLGIIHFIFNISSIH